MCNTPFDVNNFIDLVEEENKVQNIISYKDREEIIQKHVMDFLTPFSESRFPEGNRICDIGSGGGFPGILLGIYFRESKVFLFESEKRKANFLERCKTELSLNNLSVIPLRAELLSKDLVKSIDCVFIRAVSAISVCLEYAAPFLKTGGLCFLFKGPRYNEELQNSKKTIKILGYENPEIFSYTLNYKEETFDRYLLTFKKQGKTPPEFPRKPGTAKKEPLG